MNQILSIKNDVVLQAITVCKFYHQEPFISKTPYPHVCSFPLLQSFFLIGEGNPNMVTLIHSFIILRSTRFSTNRHKSGPETRFRQPCYPIYHF